MTTIPGLHARPLQRACDNRGEFLKLYQHSVVASLGEGLDPDVAEVFVSVSRRGVLRGLHFQVPPHDHTKTVVCLAGRAFDAVVDLRAGSPAFGRSTTFDLDAARPVALHVPRGCAHGFQALADGTVMAYLVSSEHAPAHDRGIRWDGAGITWPLPDPVVSDRDASFPTLDEFDSPFRYGTAT